MARYCFYCGRELKDYEKCDCRNRTYVAGEGRGSASTPPPEPAKPQAEYEDGASREEPSGGWRYEGETGSTGPRTRESRAKRVASSRTTTRDRRQTLLSFFSFFARPADAMAADLSPGWTPSHTLWVSLSLLLSGILYSLFNRSLTVLLGGQAVKIPLGTLLLSWLTGFALVALVLLLYTLTLWLLSRFLFRQGGLPFLHTLTAGKAAWKYLSLFLGLALPSLFTGGAVYGLTLVLMGLVFAVVVHARQVAALTHLDENRTWQLTYLSIIIFAGILSSVTALTRMLDVLR